MMVMRLHLERLEGGIRVSRTDYAIIAYLPGTWIYATSCMVRSK